MRYDGNMQNEAPVVDGGNLEEIRPFIGKAKKLDGRTLEVVRQSFRSARPVEGSDPETRPQTAPCPVCGTSLDVRLVAVDVPGGRSEMLPGQVIHLVLAHDWWHPSMNALLGRPDAGDPPDPTQTDPKPRRPQPRPEAGGRRRRPQDDLPNVDPRSTRRAPAPTELPFADFADPASIDEIEVDVSVLVRPLDPPAPAAETRSAGAPVRSRGRPGSENRRPVQPAPANKPSGRQPVGPAPRREGSGRPPPENRRPASASGRPGPEGRGLRREEQTPRFTGPPPRQERRHEHEGDGRQLPAVRPSPPEWRGPDGRQQPPPQQEAGPNGARDPGFFEQFGEWVRDLFSPVAPQQGGGADRSGQQPIGRWEAAQGVDAVLVDPSGREWGPGLVPAGEYELHVPGRPPSRARVEPDRTYRASGLGRLFDVVDPQ